MWKEQIIYLFSLHLLELSSKAQPVTLTNPFNCSEYHRQMGRDLNQGVKFQLLQVSKAVVPLEVCREV